MNTLTQFLLKNFFPVIKGGLTRIVYWDSNIKIGKKFRCDSIPRILIDKGCRLEIGNNVEFRRNVEIRVHGDSEVIVKNKTRIDRGVRILAANNSKIQILDGVRIGLYSVLNGGDSITIGKKCLISGFVYLQTSMHGYNEKNVSIQEQGYDHAPIVLGDDAWLGTHVVIFPGVTIGKGGIVGSNAVVTKNVEQYQIVAGVPATPLKERQ